MTAPPPVSTGDMQRVAERRRVLRAGAFLALCGATALASRRHAPARLYADEMPIGSLESAVPRQFGQWSARADIEALAINPDLREAVNQSYDATLARTYGGPGNREIALVLAYVKQVTDEHRVHPPELCYPAQGYSIAQRTLSPIELHGRPVPLIRFLALGAGRQEWVHYWIVEGPSVAESNLRRKIKRLQLGLNGKIADGLLVRVSSAEPGITAESDINTFTDDLLNAVTEQFRAKLLGVAENA